MEETNWETIRWQDLGEYQKKCINATNFWRLRMGLPAIMVPAGDGKVYKVDQEWIDAEMEEVVVEEELQEEMAG